jgi:RHS repeat-associated protein
VLNYRGDVIGLRDSSGNQVVTYTYDNFGNILTSTGTTTLGNGKLLKDENSFRYAGYFYDNETKMYYVKARYYNSNQGHFITQDPVSNVNLYAYAENNPISNFDPTGMYVAGVDCERATNTGNHYVYDRTTKVREKSKIPPKMVFHDDPKMAENVAMGIIGPEKKAAEIVEKAAIEGIHNLDIVGKKMLQQIPNHLLEKPIERGKAPTFKSDGTKVEIHHVNQEPEGPFMEMYWFDHRGKGNHKVNHPNKTSKIDRNLWNQQQTRYWEEQWDNGRW